MAAKLVDLLKFDLTVGWHDTHMINADPWFRMQERAWRTKTKIKVITCLKL
jgi:hypothetical protein